MSGSATINALARQEMLALPKIYGPGSANGPAGPPAALVSALESLETTTGVDATQLTGSQTPSSVETQTITDLQNLGSGTNGEIFIASIGATSENFIQQFAFTYAPELASGTAAVPSDAALFLAGIAPPITLVQPPAPLANGLEQVLVTDMTTGISDWEPAIPYSGPVAGVTDDFAKITTDNLNITATKQGSFIHTGAGNDAINASQSTFQQPIPAAVNVLDGGGGSNFLVGNAITANRFFLDDRSSIGDTYSTVVNLKQGDSVTIFGVNKTDFQIPMADGRGAVGYTGIDIGFLAPRHPNANLVLTGYTIADLSNGNLTMTFGKTANLPGLPSSDYAEITAAKGVFPAH